MEGDRVSASLADHRPHPPHWSTGSTVTPAAAMSQSKSLSFSHTLDAEAWGGFIKGSVMLTLTGCLK